MKNPFNAESPDRLYQSAQTYTHKFPKNNEMPISPIKLSDLQ